MIHMLLLFHLLRFNVPGCFLGCFFLSTFALLCLFSTESFYTLSYACVYVGLRVYLFMSLYVCERVYVYHVCILFLYFPLFCFDSSLSCVIL